jgi:lysophospholipase L1-like esterase
MTSITIVPDIGDPLTIILQDGKIVSMAAPAVVPPPPIYPLDGAGALPEFAYSTRRLTASYSGPAIRVVRPSDSVTRDIGFVGQDLGVSDLDSFLGAEIGHVDKWYDQSGHGRDATQTTDADRPLVESGSVAGGPVLFKNKRPLIFNEKFMNIPAGVSVGRDACNVFMALELMFALEEAGTLIQLGAGGSQLTVFQNTTDLDVSGWGSLTTLPKPIEQRPALYEHIGNGGTGTLSQDFDSTTGAISAATLAGGMIGNTDITSGYVLSGYVAAVIGYGRVLSGGEATVIRGAMRQLFNLVSVPNSGRVVFIGDSIVINGGTGNQWGYGFAKMAQRSLSNDVAFYNLGKGGTSIHDKLATYATDGAGCILQKYSDNRVVFLMYGTNDLTLLGRTAAQIYADIQTYCGYVRADGGKIIVATILPNAAWDSTQQTTRNDLNTLIRTNWASFADGLCDFANNAIMGPQSAASDSSLYGDGLHPTRLGHTYLKPDALAALAVLV